MWMHSEGSEQKIVKDGKILISSEKCVHERKTTIESQIS